MKFSFPFLFAAAAPAVAFAIYAPIPEQEQGKALTYRLGASVYHDSNIFGAPDLPIGPNAPSRVVDSMVYNLSARVAFNGSVTDQTFASAAYDLSNDYVVDRPGSKNLTSHGLSGRVAHAFSADSNIDLNVAYDIAKNPQSLLATSQLNADQSYKRGQADARYTTTVSQKLGAVTKYRLLNYAYDNAVLARQLDRTENLLGLELSHAFLPETKLLGEYRFQAINYSTDSAIKNKDSHFLMAGLDYAAGRKISFSGRLGFEDRSREAQRDTTSPYAELIGRYVYAEESYLSGGYTYALEEPSDTDRFNDSEVHRFFLNAQHRLSGPFTLSGSLTYQPSRLQGKRVGNTTQADIDEDTLRLGVGLSWRPTKNWMVAGTFDHDAIDSDDPERDQDRNRLGVSASLTF